MSLDDAAVRSSVARLEYESLFGTTEVARPSSPAGAIDTPETIDTIADEIRQCANCELCKHRNQPGARRMPVACL